MGPRNQAMAIILRLRDVVPLSCLQFANTLAIRQSPVAFVILPQAFAPLVPKSHP
jgi:hypothetical protein